ncbi:Tn3 family transposase [Streptosporangium saharense]|uniref:Tn3 family transposase n=1 Tax=Streptosporangium saharense TaxID=1706840 RepID=UPI0036D169F8
MRAASPLLVETQGKIGIAGDWGGGHVASADGMRFAVPLRSIHTRPNRKYFGSGRGATWLNVVSDRVMGLGASSCPARCVTRWASWMRCSTLTALPAPRS